MGQKLMAASPFGRVGVVKKQPWLSGSEQMCLFSFSLPKDAGSRVSDMMLISPGLGLQK